MVMYGCEFMCIQAISMCEERTQVRKTPLFGGNTIKTTEHLKHRQIFHNFSESSKSYQHKMIK